MRKFQLKVENDLTKHLQELEYKLSASQNIIQSMLSNDPGFAETPAFQMLMSRHEKLISDWENSKHEVPETCFPEWLQTCGYDFNWSLDTYHKVFDITIMTDINIPELEDYEVTSAAV